MPAPTRQRSFSAKSQPQARPRPPRKKKLDPAVREYLRPDEVEAMVQAARKSGRHQVRDAAIILLMFRHGLRTAELVALRWHQVDLTAGYLDVHRAKRGHHATHPLRGPQLRLLRALQRTYPDSPYVFLSERKAPSLRGRFAPLWREQQDGRAPLCAPSPPAPACVRLLPRVSGA
jgi:type 1 fimbriae regulatory protein FimE